MTNITCYNFNGADVRTIVLPNGEPGFVGKDVCAALEYKDHTNAMKQHCRGVANTTPSSTAALV